MLTGTPTPTRRTPFWSRAGLWASQVRGRGLGWGHCPSAVHPKEILFTFSPHPSLPSKSATFPGPSSLLHHLLKPLSKLPVTHKGTNRGDTTAVADPGLKPSWGSHSRGPYWEELQRSRSFHADALLVLALQGEPHGVPSFWRHQRLWTPELPPGDPPKARWPLCSGRPPSGEARWDELLAAGTSPVPPPSYGTGKPGELPGEAH